MKQFLCSLLILFGITFDPSAHFKNFKKEGKKQYCMVDYEHKVISCNYDSMTDCRNHYVDHHAAICFPHKSLKLGDGYETPVDVE